MYLYYISSINGCKNDFFKKFRTDFLKWLRPPLLAISARLKLATPVRQTGVISIHYETYYIIYSIKRQEVFLGIISTFTVQTPTHPIILAAALDKSR